VGGARCFVVEYGREKGGWESISGLSGGIGCCGVYFKGRLFCLFLR
jgi:hypothetical protein